MSKIQRQLEFYFSDANLVSDNFMKVEMAKNEQGWISLPVFLTFKRIKKLVEDIDGEDAKVSAIVEALEGSETLDCDGKQVKRKEPFDLETASNGRDDRTLVVKGFPVDAQLDDIIAFFDTKISGSAGINGVAAVRKWMRSQKGNEEKVFSGQVWVELKQADDADKVKAAVNDTKYGYDEDNEGQKLEALLKNDFIGGMKKKGKSSVFKIVPQILQGQEFSMELFIFAIRREFGKFNESVVAIQYLPDEKYFLVKMGGTVPSRLVQKYSNKEFKVATGFTEKIVYTCTLKVIDEQEVQNTFIDANKLIKFTLTAPEGQELPTVKQLREFFSSFAEVKFVEFAEGTGYVRLNNPVASKLVEGNKDKFETFEFTPTTVAQQAVQVKKAENQPDAEEIEAQGQADQKTEKPVGSKDEAKLKVALIVEVVSGEAEQQYWRDSVYRTSAGPSKRSRDSNQGKGRQVRQRSGR